VEADPVLGNTFERGVERLRTDHDEALVLLVGHRRAARLFPVVADGRVVDLENQAVVQ